MSRHIVDYRISPLTTRFLFVYRMSSYEGDSFVVSDRKKSSSLLLLWVRPSWIKCMLPPLFPCSCLYGDCHGDECVHQGDEHTKRILGGATGDAVGTHSFCPHQQHTKHNPKTTESFPHQVRFHTSAGYPVAFTAVLAWTRLARLEHGFCPFHCVLGGALSLFCLPTLWFLASSSSV
jgi:hypothetical protein